MASTSTNKRKGKSPEKPCRKSPWLCFEEQDNESSTCVICLEIIKNKSFANKCLHKFCFECLLKWSKQKAECPLCNGPFTAIIHNVKSDQEYDEHIIESIPSEDGNSYLNSIVNLFFDSNTSDSSTSDSSTHDYSSTIDSNTSDSNTSDSSTSDSNGEDDSVTPSCCNLL